MGYFGAFDISASGLTAQRLRLDLISNNVANINTTRTGALTPEGNQIPYSRQVATFTVRKPGVNSFAGVLRGALTDGRIMNGAGILSNVRAINRQHPGLGVQVENIRPITDEEDPFRLEYEPTSPDAITVAEPGLPVGYVRKPNVNIVAEMVDVISASRAYEANVTVLNVSKSMMTKALEIGKG